MKVQFNHDVMKKLIRRNCGEDEIAIAGDYENVADSSTVDIMP